MNILNAQVTHITFGNGIIADQTENTLDVQFADRNLRMAYPMAFDGYLALTDKNLQEEVEKKINEIKAEKEKKAEELRLKLLQARAEEEKASAELDKKKEAKKESKAVNKSKLKRIFEETLNLCEEDDTLRPAICSINEKQKVILESDELNLPDMIHQPEIKISGKRSVEAASAYKNKRVCVLNFASGEDVGGKVREGGNTSEESLYRISTLYRSLATSPCWNQFYKPHRNAGNPLYNDDLIYTPGVIVFMTDTELPELMPESDWFNIDVITCAAPKLKKKENRAYFYEGCEEGGIPKEELQKIMEGRIDRIFKVAHQEGAQVLISGACDTYHNDKKLIAGAFKKAVEKYGSWFDTIEFAIHEDSEKKVSSGIFRKAFGMDEPES